LARALRIYEHAASLVIAAVFIASGMLHLENPYYLLSSVYSYDITGPLLGQVVAMVLPVAQLVIGACLLGRLCVSGALLASALLSSVFCAAQIAGLWRKLDIDCGCFGSAYTQPIGAASILLALGTVALAGSAYVAWLKTMR
jgi:hypothetical protein